jgi:hypothetical protein
MEGLSRMDQAEFQTRMQGECRRIMGRIAEAVNAASTGNVIGSSEMQVRDLMAELRQKAYETAVQMRVDSHASTFSPSAGRGGEAAGEQGAQQPQRADVQRADQLVAPAVVRRGRGQRRSGGQAAG